MNIAYYITYNNLVIMDIESVDSSPGGTMHITGYVNEQHYHRLSKFYTTIIKMNMPVTDGRLEYVYSLRPFVVERILQENDRCKVSIISRRLDLISRSAVKHTV